MNDLLNAFKDQLRLWLNTTRRLIGKPRGLPADLGPGDPVPEGAPPKPAALFNAYYYLAIGSFVFFQFLYGMATSKAENDAQRISRSAAQLLELMRSAGFVEILLKISLPIAATVLVYLLVTKLIHWKNRARRITAFNTLLYYGSLGLFILPLLLYMGNFIFNMVADKRYELFELHFFGDSDDDLDLLTIIWFPYLVILLLTIVLACLQLFGPYWKQARVHVRTANALTMLLFVPLPQITCSGFAILYYNMAEREVAAAKTPGVVPLSRLQLGRDDRPIPGFIRSAGSHDFVSRRIHCLNNSQRPVYLRRDAYIVGTYGPEDGVKHAEREGGDVVSNDDASLWSAQLNFQIADWKEDADADVLFLRPGESTWFKLRLNADDITDAHGDVNVPIRVTIPFEVIGGDIDDSAEELSEDWWLVWSNADRKALVDTERN